MRNVCVALAVAAAAAVAQDVERAQRAVVQVQSVDRALERAQRLRAQNAPIRALRDCRIHQPYVLVVSGVAISAREILTPALHPRADLHVTITYHDGRRADAELVGTDPLSNLALVRVPSDSPAHLDLATDAVQLEDALELVGVGPDGGVARLGCSVNREQTPVPIRDLYGVTRNGVITLGSAFAVATTEGFPNLGFACVDGGGKLVGLVAGGLPTRLVPDEAQPGRFTRLEVRFAVPAARIARIVDDLREHGRVIRAQFGVLVNPVDDALRAHFELPASACSIEWIEEHGPMARAGARLRDVILAVDGETYRDTAELGEALTDKEPGSPVELEILREGEPMTLTALPTEWK